jgi:superfamily II DNA/RNA helicase
MSESGPSKSNTSRAAILNKFGIEKLNAMQEETYSALQSNRDVVLLSPTGTGKTLAFLLPLIEKLKEDCTDIQALILVPSRELAQQIESVVRNMGSGFKVNAVYGGRSGSQDKVDLRHRPAILIGTPGRVADRLRRDNIELEELHTLILDEFDKSLEIGFEKEMMEIVRSLTHVKQRILTSATDKAEIPSFVRLRDPLLVKHSIKENKQLLIQIIQSPEKDKLNSLWKILSKVDNQPGIIFCNFKDSIDRLSDFLDSKYIAHGCFYGGMEQIDRERALIKFRNGTHQLLLATDLAARGLDIPEIKFIIHYHLPIHEKEFTHRNGRTARMNRDGVAYVLHHASERLPQFIQESNAERLDIDKLKKEVDSPSLKWKTIYLTGGRRDKISKGDVAGLFYQQGLLEEGQLGRIELQQNCTYVGVPAELANELLEATNNKKLKGRKLRVSLL